MTEHRPLVRFGDTEVADGIVSCRVTNSINEPSSAEITISADALINVSPDYQAEVEVAIATGGQIDLLLTGFTVAAEPSEAGIVISATTNIQRLSEEKTGGLGYRSVNPREMIWGLLRASGMESEKISIEGFEPGPLEVFEVATALDGINIEDAVSLGRVRLLPHGPVVRLADGLGPEELRDRYAGASAWAYTLQTARTLFDAETEGLRTIDAALAWLTTRTHYSGVGLPMGGTRRFRREWTLARVSRRDVVAAHGVGTGRKWLRSPQGIAYRPELVLAEVEDLDLPPLPLDVSPQMREAFSSWRRAAEEADPLAAVVALWESVEFYVSGVSVDDLFTKPERRALLKVATEGLAGEQLDRVREVVGRLNEAPLMVRLRETLRQDNVTYTQEEILLLRKLRNLRNDFVHGRSRELPSEADLRYAKAIVNRMLVYRVARLCQSSRTGVSGGGSVPDLLRSISESSP